MKKRLGVITLLGSLAVNPALAVFAENTGSGTANQAVVSAMTSLSNDMVATGQSIIPIALTIIGLSAVVIFGVRMFFKVAGIRK